MSKEGVKHWERPWNTEEIVEHADNWNLACDAALLNTLKEFGDKILSKAENVNEKIENLERNLSRVHLKVDLARNDFSSLRNTQFVECRVYEDDETIPSEKPKIVDENNVPEEETIEDFKDAVALGLEILSEHYERVKVTVSDSEDEDGDEPSFVYRRKDPYINRRLPLVIGTEEWHQKWHVGLEDTDSENENSSEKFSDSESDDNYSQNKIHSDVSSELSNLSGFNTSKPQPVTTSTANTTKQDIGNYASDTFAEPIPKNSFAEQLAAKLGNVIKEKEDLNEPEVNKRPIQKKPSDYGALFSDEPPPLDDLNVPESHGIFSGGKGLFDDEDDLWNTGETKIPQVKASGPKQMTKKSDQVDVGKGLFDTDSDDDIFAQSKNYSASQNIKPYLQTGKPVVPVFEEDPPDFDENTTNVKEKKKPQGAVSLFGKNDVVNEKTIGKILKQRRVSSSSDEETSEIIPDNIKKPLTTNVVKKDPILNSQNKKTTDSTISTVPKSKEPEKKKSLFDDDIFGDDLFSSIDKKSTSSLFEKSVLFSDDDSSEPFTINENTTKKDIKPNNTGISNIIHSPDTPNTEYSSRKNSKSNINTFFIDSTNEDVNILTAKEDKNKVEKVKESEKSLTNNKKPTKGIFDDLDDVDDLFSPISNKKDSTKAKKTKIFLFDDDEDDDFDIFQPKNNTKIQKEKDEKSSKNSKSTAGLFDDDLFSNKTDETSKNKSLFGEESKDITKTFENPTEKPSVDFKREVTTTQKVVGERDLIKSDKNKSLKNYEIKKLKDENESTTIIETETIKEKPKISKPLPKLFDDTIDDVDDLFSNKKEETTKNKSLFDESVQSKSSKNATKKQSVDFKDQPTTTENKTDFIDDNKPLKNDEVKEGEDDNESATNEHLMKKTEESSEKPKILKPKLKLFDDDLDDLFSNKNDKISENSLFGDPELPENVTKSIDDTTPKKIVSLESKTQIKEKEIEEIKDDNNKKLKNDDKSTTNQESSKEIEPKLPKVSLFDDDLNDVDDLFSNKNDNNSKQTLFNEAELSKEFTTTSKTIASKEPVDFEDPINIFSKTSKTENNEKTSLSNDEIKKVENDSKITNKDTTKETEPTKIPEISVEEHLETVDSSPKITSESNLSLESNKYKSSPSILNVKFMDNMPPPDDDWDTYSDHAYDDLDQVNDGFQSQPSSLFDDQPPSLFFNDTDLPGNDRSTPEVQDIETTNKPSVKLDETESEIHTDKNIIENDQKSFTSTTDNSSIIETTENKDLEEPKLTENLEEHSSTKQKETKTKPSISRQKPNIKKNMEESYDPPVSKIDHDPTLNDQDQPDFLSSNVESKNDNTIESEIRKNLISDKTIEKTVSFDNLDETRVILDEPVIEEKSEDDMQKNISKIAEKLQQISSKTEERTKPIVVPKKLSHNLNINVGALLPGSTIPSPKREKNPKETEALSKSLPASRFNLNEEFSGKPFVPSKPIRVASLESTPKKSQTLETSSSFDGGTDIEVLRSITKDRARIPVKRRPSSRRARQKSLRDSISEFRLGDPILDDSLTSKSDSQDSADKTSEDHTPENSVGSSEKSPKEELPTSTVENEIKDEEDLFKTLDEEIKNVSTANIVRTKKKEDSENEISKEPEKTVLKKVDNLFEDDDDLFGSLKKEKSEIQKEVKKSGEKTKSIFDDSPETDKSNMFGKTDYSKPLKRKEEKKDSLFDSSDDDDIFQSSKTKVTPKIDEPKISVIGKIAGSSSSSSSKIQTEKTNLFDSDDEDFFGNVTNQKKNKVEEDTKIVKIQTKQLFDDEDNDDLFGTSTKNKTKQDVKPSVINKKPPKSSSLRKLGNLEGDEDPLSALLK